MSLGDNIDVNTNERASSQDIDDLQSLITRNRQEMLRFLYQVDDYPDSGLVGNSDQDLCLGGLIATASGTDVSVSAGALAQFSSAILPAAGSFDTDYRMGVNRAATAVAAPSPGSNTFYLLEAQITETVTNATRDIYDPGIPGFVPTSVAKFRTFGIQFQFTAGTATTAPATSTDWVPIAIVFRPGGGGAVLDSHIRDVRTLPRDVRRVTSQTPDIPTYITDYLRTNSIPGTGSLSVKFDFEVIDPLGRRLFARSDGAISLTTTIGAQTAGTFPGVSGTITYLYLGATSNGYAPNSLYGNVAHRGILTLSSVAPTDDGLNGSAISVTDPTSGLVTTLPADEAVCVAALISDGTNWYPQTQASGRVVIEPQTISGTGTVPGPITYGAGGEIPRNVQAVDLRVNVTATVAGEIRVRPDGAGATDIWDTVQFPGANNTFRTAVPLVNAAGDQFELEAVSGTVSAIAVSMVGYQLRR